MKNYAKLKNTIQNYIKEQMELGWMLFAIGDANICIKDTSLEPFFIAVIDDDKQFLIIHQRDNPQLEIKIPISKLPTQSGMIDLAIVNKTIEGCSGNIFHHANGICLLVQVKDRSVQIYAIPSDKFYICFDF